MKVGTKEDVLISIVPVLDAPVSRGHLCVKGRYAFDFVSAGIALPSQ
jgi:formate dehydrogenase major subunit